MSCVQHYRVFLLVIMSSENNTFETWIVEVEYIAYPVSSWGVPKDLDRDLRRREGR